MRPLLIAICAGFWGCIFVDPFPEVAPDRTSNVPTVTDAAAETVDAATDGCDGDRCAPLKATQWSAFIASSASFESAGFIAADPTRGVVLAASGEGNWTAGGSPVLPAKDRDVGLLFVSDGAIQSAKRLDFGGREIVDEVAFAEGGAVWVSGIGAIEGSQIHPLVRKIDAMSASTASAAIDSADATSQLRCSSVAVKGAFVAIGCTGRGTITFTRPDDSTGSLTTDGSDDAFVARLDENTGRVVWARRFGGESSDVVSAVAVDAQGDVYVAGRFESVSLSPLALTRVGTRANAFVARLRAIDGSSVWAMRYGDSVDPPILGQGESSTMSARKGVLANAIALDGKGNVVIGGAYRGTVDFGGAATQADAPGFYVLCSDAATGARRWSKVGRGPAEHGGSVSHVAFDDSGHIAVSGSVLGKPLGTFDNRSFAIGGLVTAFSAKLASKDGLVESVRSFVGSTATARVFGVGAGFGAKGETLVGLEVPGPTTIDLGTVKVNAAPGLAGVVAWVDEP